MTRILIWDIPTRLLHWLLASLFVGAFGVANLVDDDSPAFRVHMLMGLVMAFIVLLRVVWGVVGTRWARFGSFLYGPAALVDFLRGGRRYAGHNPGAAAATFAILALVLALGATGLMMGRGSEAAEEVHEVLAWALLGVVGIHLAGVAWHTVRHRENIALSMVDGHKKAEPGAAIGSARPAVGLLFLALTGAWAASLVGGYDAATGQVTLPVVGAIQLGEGEEGEGGEHGERGEHEDDDD